MSAQDDFEKDRSDYWGPDSRVFEKEVSGKYRIGAVERDFQFYHLHRCIQDLKCEIVKALKINKIVGYLTNLLNKK